MTNGSPRLAALAIRLGGAVAVAILAAGLGTGAPALAQSAASRIDQPTPATLPPEAAQDGGDRRVAPPGAIRSSTDVVKGGAVQGDETPSRTNPLQHLPKDMR